MVRPGGIPGGNALPQDGDPFRGAASRRDSRVRARLKLQSGVWVAGLAAALFLLDKNTYGPVMYVANRGFIISLVFGLLCLHAHLRWRTTKSSAWMWLSALWLLLSLLANEGGASTLAFLVAYALVLEPGGWRPRLTSLLPAAAVMLGWRAVYVGSGFGVRNFTGYIDPGYEPLLFLREPRAQGQRAARRPTDGSAAGSGARAQRPMANVLALFFAVFSLALRRGVLARSAAGPGDTLLGGGDAAGAGAGGDGSIR